MAIARVQSKAGSNPGGSTCVVTFDSAVTAGNLIGVFVTWNASTNAVTGVADNKGNGAYSVGNSPSSAFFGAYKTTSYYKAAVATGGTSFSVTVTAAGAVASVFLVTIAEFSGVASASPVDGTVDNATGTGNTGYTSAAAITTTASGDVLISQIMATVSGGTPAGSWLQLDAPGYSAHPVIYLIAGAAGSYPALRNSVGNQDWTVQNIAFKEAVVATPTNHLLTMMGVGT